MHSEVCLPTLISKAKNVSPQISPDCFEAGFPLNEGRNKLFPRIPSETESFQRVWWIINIIFLNSFSLSCSSKDFGEYQESYYSVQTTEGEQISQLIAGYIDIILKKASGVARLYAAVLKAAGTALTTAVPHPSAEAEQRSLRPGGRRGVHHAGGVGFSQEVSQTPASPDDGSDSANTLQPFTLRLNLGV